MNLLQRSWRATTRAVVTDVHFWVPVAVLAIGLALLAIFGQETGGAR